MGCEGSKSIPVERLTDDDRKKKKRRKRQKRDRRRRRPEERTEEDVVPQPEIDPDEPIAPAQIIPEIHYDPDNMDEFDSKETQAVQVQVADPNAFNSPFIRQRDDAINNASYRTSVDSWEVTSLPELVRSIAHLSKGKSFIDRHWIIYYWITRNIEYDTVSYFSKDFSAQEAEDVFRTRKGVCAGYGNLYKYICDRLKLVCEIVGGYSKGYGFDDRDGAEPQIDHAWNAVKIYDHWYLVESTWGAGHLTDEKEFKRELSTYYFLPRPEQMVYHHLPEDEKWQLVRNPISLEQFTRMPKLRPEYFEYNLELLQPRDQHFVDLNEREGYALVVMKAPTDVKLIAKLKLHDQIVEGGCEVVFDQVNRVYNCFFAPQTVGKHKITIFVKRGKAEDGEYSSALDLALPVREMPAQPISYPKKWKTFFDCSLRIVSPQRTHLIRLQQGEQSAQICLRAPPDVELMGQLTLNEEKIVHGERVYFDRQKNYWRCKFAPNQAGLFEATILAKRRSDSGNFTSAVAFKIDATECLAPPYLSYPTAWQLFFDLKLKVLSPVGRGKLVLKKQTPYAEIFVQTPIDVELLGQLQDDRDEQIKTGVDVHFDREKNAWLCRFAPDRPGNFQAIIMAKKTTESGMYKSAVAFTLVTQGRSFRPVALLQTTQLYHDLGIEVLSPKESSSIVMPVKSKYVEILIKTPLGVDLLGGLTDENKNTIESGSQVYYDRAGGVWVCRFAPPHSGQFEAGIYAKKDAETTSYSPIVTYQIDVKHDLRAPTSFPKTWQAFFDFGLKIESPKLQSTVPWSDDSSFAEVLLQAPDDIQVSGTLECGNEKVNEGSLIQFDHQRNLWQCLFAPQQIGQHQLVIFAKRKTEEGSKMKSVLMFDMDVKQLHNAVLFPKTYTQFEAMKSQIVTPLHGVLKKNSTVRLELNLPGAVSVSISVDEKPLKNEALKDSILQRDITVGSREVIIYGKYGQSPHYTSLIQYTVQ